MMFKAYSNPSHSMIKVFIFFTSNVLERSHGVVSIAVSNLQSSAGEVIF